MSCSASIRNPFVARRFARPARAAAAAAAATAVAAAFLSAAAARAAEPPADAGARLSGRALGSTPLMADLAELCDGIGGRPTGSAAYEKAVAWAAAKLKAAGADEVRLEEFEVPFRWTPGATEAECVAPARFPVRLSAAPGSPGTPGAKALEAPVVDAGSGTADEWKALGAKATGAIVLVHSGEMRTADDLFGEYMRNKPLGEAAAAAGASALLLESSRPRNLLYRHPAALAGKPFPVPAAIVAREEFERVARLAAGGPVRMSLLLGSSIGPAFRARNVVAELRGRQKPEEVVVLGAHLDSWELGTGANDDGVNVALVIDVLRGMKELGVVPRRTVRFVLFGGEEQGMYGSAGYVRAHAGEMDRHAAVVVFDVGSGRTSGFYLDGRPELRSAVDAALAAAAGLGPFAHPDEAIDGTDNFDFLLSGVPNLVANQDWAPYLPDYHAESDTLDKVDPREARANAAIASALVWGLAESPGRAPRQGRAEVEKLIERTKLDEQMKAFDQWEPWKAGTRGAAPAR